jgi:hypothetical protein
MDRHLAIGFVAPLALLVLLVSSAAAYAQTPAAPAQGPLTLEPIHSPLVVAGDYKITDLDGRAAHMAGVRAGRLVDDMFFVGGAAYWLPDGPNRSELTYGGAVIGWSSNPQRRISFGGSGLVGAGTAQILADFTVLQRGRIDPRHIGRPVLITASDGTRAITARVRDDFFVFEPQANLNTRVTRHFSVDWSAGYRVTAAARSLENRIDGVTGSLALRFTF